jgi:hypothetical protein
MWKAFQRYRALDSEARRLFRRAVILLPWVALSLRIRGFKKTNDALQTGSPSTSLPPQPGNLKVGEIVHKTSRMVIAAAHYGLVHPTCLVESLVLWNLLQRQGVPAALRIGVRKASDKFEAHAWVEFEGAALNQPEQQHRHYAAFDNGFSDLPGENQ